jgi:hypothetical protein
VYRYIFVGLLIVTILSVATIVLKYQLQIIDWQEGSYHMNPIYDLSTLQKVVIS